MCQVIFLYTCEFHLMVPEAKCRWVRDCDPEKWSTVSGRKTGTKSDTKEFNAYLDTVQSKGYQVYRSLLETGAELSAKNVQNVLMGVSGRPKMILEIFQDHNQKLYQLIGHSSIKTTQIYAKIVDKKISEDMNLLKARASCYIKKDNINI